MLIFAVVALIVLVTLFGIFFIPKIKNLAAKNELKKEIVSGLKLYTTKYESLLSSFKYLSEAREKILPKIDSEYCSRLESGFLAASFSLKQLVNPEDKELLPDDKSTITDCRSKLKRITELNHKIGEVSNLVKEAISQIEEASALIQNGESKVKVAGTFLETAKRRLALLKEKKFPSEEFEGQVDQAAEQYTNSCKFLEALNYEKASEAADKCSYISGVASKGIDFVLAKLTAYEGALASLQDQLDDFLKKSSQQAESKITFLKAHYTENVLGEVFMRLDKIRALKELIESQINEAKPLIVAGFDKWPQVDKLFNKINSNLLELKLENDWLRKSDKILASQHNELLKSLNSFFPAVENAWSFYLNHITRMPETAKVDLRRIDDMVSEIKTKLNTFPCNLIEISLQLEDLRKVIDQVVEKMVNPPKQGEFLFFGKKTSFF